MAYDPLAQNGTAARLTLFKDRVLDRFHARLSGFARANTAFVSQPEPRTIGSYARGCQLKAGNFLFAGHLVLGAGKSLWKIDCPDSDFAAQQQGFAWLDDLAAVGDQQSQDLAQDWLMGWIARYGKGKGNGWTPELTGRRMIRWINNALFVMKAQDKEAGDLFFRSLAHQTSFLSKRWRSAPAGLPRFEALTGLIYAGLALEGAGHLVLPSMEAMADECANRIDPDGGIPSRNPEELMEVFTLLNWAAAALSEAGQIPLRQHLLAIERVAPTLRALRHADGSLARFHGGSRGLEGRLDLALVSSGVRATASTNLAMGFARMSAGRTSIVTDASAPAQGVDSFNAHASTLAFELTSGRRPIIANCGTGAAYGVDWRRAGRATPSHSTLAIEGYSSSRFAARRRPGRGAQELLIDVPQDVRVQQSSGLDGTSVLMTHDGYSRTHGLMHVRRLDLSVDGRELAGQDTLGALSESERVTFEALMNENQLRGVRYNIRFHMHPEVQAEIDLGGAAVSLSLKSGEVWVFRHDGVAEMSLDASVYLEAGRLKPRATMQIVLSGVVLDYSSLVNWTLSRAQDGRRHIRDIELPEG